MKFTLRDLFWLIVVAAMVAAWYADRGRQSSIYKKELEQAEHSAANQWTG